MRRRADRAGLAGDRARQLPDRAARDRGRALGRGSGRRRGSRTDARRRARRARRLATGLPGQPAARRRDRLARAPAARARRRATAGCPTCRRRDARRSDWHSSRSAIVEGNDWGWSARRHARPASSAAALLIAGVVLRSRATRARSSSPSCFADRSFRIGNLGTLLFSAAFFSIVLGNVLFLTSVWGYTRLQGRRSRRCPVRPVDDHRRARRQARRPLRPPGRGRPGRDPLRRRGHGPALGRGRAGLARRSGCPAPTLTGIGIGLAFPTLGSAAVRDIPDDRFATASAVNAAFRQIGAVLGTALLITIVGNPRPSPTPSPPPTAPTCSPPSPRSWRAR